MRNLILAGFFALAGLSGPTLIPQASAAIVNITTLDGVINTGLVNGTSNLENAGVWKAPISSTQTANNNSNYITGFNNNGTAHSFFSFDLSLLGGQSAAAMTLQLRRFSSNVGNTDPTETVGFFDVSTDPVSLNGNSLFSQAIFDDLGGGNSYGTVTVAGTGLSSDIISIVLNAQAITDINADLTIFLANPITANRYFSIGGALLTDDGNDGIFGGSNLGNETTLPRPTLVVTTQDTVASAPEPMTLAAFGVGLLGMAGVRRRRNRR